MAEIGAPETDSELPFGERFHRARVEAKMSGPRAARELGYAKAQSIYDIERGRSSPDPERLRDAAELFGVSASWLAGSVGADVHAEYVDRLVVIANTLPESRQRELVRIAEVIQAEVAQESSILSVLKRERPDLVPLIDGLSQRLSQSTEDQGARAGLG